MHIKCPHCTTSYALDSAALGTIGRTVRCSRCKEVWVARPEDAVAAETPEWATAQGGETMAAPAPPNRDDAAAEWEALAGQDDSEAAAPPVVDSPSIAADAPVDEAAVGDAVPPAMAAALNNNEAAPIRPATWFRKLRRPNAGAPGKGKAKASINLPILCSAMGALAMALLIWRVDVVRLLPQTATFYRSVGLDVNLRGLLFKDVKVTSETSDGKQVLVIEGVITDEARKPVELPRLRFSVRDAQGAEIYAWNAVLEQPILKPGERAWFKSRLASPPPEGREIDVRFFNKRDLAGGHT